MAATENYITQAAFQENGAAASRNISNVGNYTPEFSATWVGLG